MEKLLQMSQGNVIWITKMENIRYLTGFSGSTAECTIIDGKITLITDGRYTTQSKQEAYENVDIVIVSETLSYTDAVQNNFKNANKIIIEGNEVSAATYNQIKKDFDNEIELTSNLIENYRHIKNENELNLIRKAVEISDKVFSYVVENIKPGMTEKDVKVMIDSKHIEFGADGPSFDAIVASGSNAAKPHAYPSEKVIEDGDILTLDFGCFYKGYCSDMTRTFFVGQPKDEELVKIHEIVLEAHKMQIDACKAGVKLKDIDKIGRDYITKHGYGDKFNHSTGHGIGLEIHEAISISTKAEIEAEENMVLTIEPGIYLEGKGGCRIENDVIITKEGCEILNKSDRSSDVYNKK